MNHNRGTLDRFVYALAAIVIALCTCCGLGGCKKDNTVKPVAAHWAVICVRNDQPVRTSDESCNGDFKDRFHLLYVDQVASGFIPIAAVGQQIDDGQPDGGLVTTTVRPATEKIFGSVPYNGGIGVIFTPQS